MYAPSTIQRPAVSQSGFSLIELLVSVSILTVISTIVLANHARFSSDILLGNLAYDIALSVRQAQVYGLSVRESAAGTGNFGQGYGVHFDADDNTSYALFIDDNENDAYDSPGELLEAFSLHQGNVIAEFCARTPGGVEKCSPTAIEKLDILFKRPDPDALIKSDIASDVYQTARIRVQSPQGTTRDVFIASTGQISVEQEAQEVAP